MTRTLQTIGCLIGRGVNWFVDDVVLPLLAVSQILLWALVLFVVFCGGCIPHKPQTPAPEPTPKPVIVAPIVDDTPDALTLKVSAESSLVATLHEIIGSGGSVTLNPEQPIVVSRPEATLTIKPGTQLNYTMTADGGSFTFSEPRPRVTAKVWGLRVSPELTRLELSADNTGTAHVQSGPIKLQRRFALNWEQPSGATETEQPATTRPVVTIYTTDGCRYCDMAKAELRNVDQFELREIHTRSGKVPGWVTSYPTLHWQVQNGWRQSVGWVSGAAFVETWQRSQAMESANYQGRSSTQWTFPGSTRNELIAHLQQGEHSGKFTRQQLDAMTFNELQQLHADDHENNVNWQLIQRPSAQQAANSFRRTTQQKSRACLF
jgi:hypothetical protein